MSQRATQLFTRVMARGSTKSPLRLGVEVALMTGCVFALFGLLAGGSLAVLAFLFAMGVVVGGAGALLAEIFLVPHYEKQGAAGDPGDTSNTEAELAVASASETIDPPSQ